MDMSGRTNSEWKSINKNFSKKPTAVENLLYSSFIAFFGIALCVTIRYFIK